MGDHLGGTPHAVDNYILLSNKDSQYHPLWLNRKKISWLKILSSSSSSHNKDNINFNYVIGITAKEEEQQNNKNMTTTASTNWFKTYGAPDKDNQMWRQYSRVHKHILLYSVQEELVYLVCFWQGKTRKEKKSH